MSMVLTLFVDGASRGNPGAAGVGVYAYTTDPAQPLFELGCFLGKATNNVAEYAALALGLAHAKTISNVSKIRVFADSELLVKQVNGIYRVRHPELQKWYRLVRNITGSTPYSIAHVRREKNSEADRLANAGIDTKTPLPEHFSSLKQRYIT